MRTIQLTPDAVEAYKELLTNPAKYGLPFKPLAECFETSEEVMPKHLLYEAFMNYFQRDLPKVIFYIIMDDLYNDKIDKGKEEDGEFMGYRLKLNVTPPADCTEITGTEYNKLFNQNQK